MRVLCVGDVCGSIGCGALIKLLPRIKRERGIDFVIVNGENSADSNGWTADSISSIYAAGADVITGGNHSFRRPESFSVMDSDPFLIRPLNVTEFDAGRGACVFDAGRHQIGVINLSGVYGLEKLGPSCPFEALDRAVNELKEKNVNIILVDVHAEATSEKRALGIYADGKVSALFGTHTHVLTADAQVLEGGTGYITDIGMTGPVDSVLGVRSDIIISRYKDRNMQKFVLAEGECFLNGCIFDIDDASARCVSAEAITVYEGGRL